MVPFKNCKLARAQSFHDLVEYKKVRSIFLLLLVNFTQVSCDQAPTEQADDLGATSYTKELNEKVYKDFDFGNTKNFDQAKKGYLAPLDNNGIVKNKDGKVIWDFGRFKKNFKVGSKAPATVHPSLWRQTQLLTYGGLFEVVPGVYQIRSLDLANMTIVESQTGIIIYDPLLSQELARAALELYYKHRGKKKVVAVIYSHSHADHFGGAKGIVNPSDVKSGKVKIYAPVGFNEHAIAENLSAGAAMSRRAVYMFGSSLPISPKGQVSSGLGLSISSGIISLIEPTDLISKTGEIRIIDGLEHEFIMALNSEAPAEMMWYVPRFKMVSLAENATYTMHNLYTLRGAKTRDASLWAKYLNEVIQTWGKKYKLAIGMHHWPTWGNTEVTEHVKAQRDLYKFLHDQTVQLMNKGFTINEIPEQIKMPKSLKKVWSTQGYYGSKSHNVRAIYNYYLGYFDGNPSHLDPIPPSQEAKHYVEALGGPDKVYNLGKEAYNTGKYKWASTLLNHLVFYDPDNKKARLLLANALTQLGYQAKSGPWRNFYLTGAKELREGPPEKNPGPTREKEILATLPIEKIFSFMAIQLDANKAEGKKISVNWHFSDTNEKYRMVLENSVLNHWQVSNLEKADATITITRDLLNRVLSRQIKYAKLFTSDDVKVEGSTLSFMKLMLCLDRLAQYAPFNLIEP